MKNNIFSIERNKPISPLELKIYRNYRVVHGIRIALAFVITFLLIRMLNLPDHSWPLITLIVVMGPISYMGNVIPRALERMAGTVGGAILGIIALHIEMYSLTMMMLWCGCAAFLCGFLAMSKRPYAALLIGITLAVVSSAPAGDLQTALWRSTNIIIGCILAMLFTSIFPQRAFINWRIQLADFLSDYLKITTAGVSRNVLAPPRMTKLQTRALNNVVKMRSLITPVNKETKIAKSLLEDIQSITRDMIAAQKFQINAHWASRGSRFLILNTHTLSDMEQMTRSTLNTLAHALHEGNPTPIASNSEHLLEITKELHCLLLANEGEEIIESAVHGYVWLSIQLAIQLEALSTLITKALTEQIFS
ncbi:FUSC family protein [Citrobacter braakii]|uniref:FUSC family protein n=1 Tax=Citrobacter TaxID=544 RepID=UPI00218226BE|nr:MULTISPECIES: FUSC family protein [Citrobacter]MCS8550744.1 FUSC family protein [Citrobacter sp. XY323]WFV16373.1 FUSC family protein [Citrobacter braakii]